MSRTDWLLDGARSDVAAERIYTAAAELIYRDGFDAFSIDALAERVHCSRATVYRHAGGKSDIREAVAARAGARIIDTVRRSVDGRSGADRVLTAVTVAVTEIRAHPAGQLFFDSTHGVRKTTWLTASPAIAAFATELAGLADDPAAAAWIVRLVLSLLFWPGDDARAETELLQRFVAPAFS
ncbi:MAG: helix-turn-helix domain-containing protein [Mycobacterium sp.]|nr:helix-turn-helix domain-containing protein [Mycobacterium sp.]